MGVCNRLIKAIVKQYPVFKETDLANDIELYRKRKAAKAFDWPGQDALIASIFIFAFQSRHL